MGHVERNDPLKRKGPNSPQVLKYEFAYEKLKDAKNVVDLGCGLGYGLKIFKDHGMDIVGVDYSDAALKEAYIRYPGMYLLHDLNNVSIHGFEGAVCLETVCQLDNPQEFINNLTVKYLVISAPLDPNPNDGYIYRKHSLSEEQFKGLFKDGWEIKDELRQSYGVVYLTLYVEKTI